MSGMEDTSDTEGREVTKSSLSAAQRARMERQRLRARALHDARLVRRPPTNDCDDTVGKSIKIGGKKVVDSGGGFLLEDSDDEDQAASQPTLAARPAPVIHISEQPHCLDCQLQFPQSYLYDNFDYSVCDSCRDDEDKHALITRTEAKSEFLLKDCDLDLRPPALRCVRRRNPHRASYSEMRLYLRAQVAVRALDVWGSQARLEAERAARAQRRDKARHTHAQRRLRALRMDVRSSLYERRAPHHVHRFGDELYHEHTDTYERTCLDCGHVETYEKM